MVDMKYDMIKCDNDQYRPEREGVNQGKFPELVSRRACKKFFLLKKILILVQGNCVISQNYFFHWLIDSDRGTELYSKGAGALLAPV